MWIGELSSLFCLVILSLRHFFLVPAPHYPFLVAVMLVGFFPSLFVSRFTDWRLDDITIVNAVLLISAVVFTLHDWMLASAYILVPVYSLLFKRKRVYIFACVAAVLALALFCLIQATSSATPTLAIVRAVDALTIFIILVFIVYFVVNDLLRQLEAETINLQTIRTLAKTVEARHAYTFGHSDRVSALGRLLAEHLPLSDVEVVANAGLIHDVGKLGTPDAILTKPGRLTDEEFAIIKRHPKDGAQICSSLGIDEALIQGVRSHHERWDGAGYPDALAGEGIPATARILCVADAVDAMASRRAYRQALGEEAIKGELGAGRASQFDPAVVDAALANWPAVWSIVHRERPVEAAPGPQS